MKVFHTRCFVIVLPLLIVSCSLQNAPAQPENHADHASVPYKDLLGKAVTDKVVTNFLAANHCTSAAAFELCEDLGVALYINLHQLVETVYFYLNNVSGFSPYNGELPFGLKFYDTMGAVEYKLKRQGIGRVGLPDHAESPDHIHYNVTYQQAHLTIVYNSPAEDEDASIYAILVTE